MPEEFFEPALEHLFDLHADLHAAQSLGRTPVGVRNIVPLKSGRITGPKLNGELLGEAAADWSTFRTDGSMQIDVRLTIKTDDGALIYCNYGGLIVAEPAVAAQLFSGQDVPLRDYYQYITPVFLTGDERYAWLNQVVSVGRGRVLPGAVEYRVWALRNP